MEILDTPEASAPVAAPAAAETPVIELRHLDRHFGSLHVLNDVSLKVSGCGHRPVGIREVNPVQDD